MQANSTIKAKPCKECGSIFHTKMYHNPRKPIQRSTIKKKVNVVKASKPKVTKTKAKKNAWDAFSRYIRIRDCLRFTGDPDNGRCVTCNREYPLKQLQAGHFIGGRQNAVLFGEDIVFSQCYGCNVGKSGNYLDYYYFMERELGSKEAVDSLVIQYRQKTVTYKIPDLIEIEQLYKEKVKQLLGEK